MSETKDNIKIEQDNEYLIFKVRKDSNLWKATNPKVNKKGNAYLTSIKAGLYTPKDAKEANPIWFEDDQDEKKSYGLVEFKVIGIDYS